MGYNTPKSYIDLKPKGGGSQVRKYLVWPIKYMNQRSTQFVDPRKKRTRSVKVTKTPGSWARTMSNVHVN